MKTDLLIFGMNVHKMIVTDNGWKKSQPNFYKRIQFILLLTNIKGEESVMKAKVDSGLCSGTGLCEDTCPEVFELQSGISTVKVDEVPADAEERCKQAMQGCPTEAISIEE